MKDFHVKLEIAGPQRHRVPDTSEPLTVYSGENVTAWMVIPAGDGEYKEYPNHIQDTADGWHKHRKEQAKILGQEEPLHPYAKTPSYTEYWQIPYRVDGGEVHHIHAKTEYWERRDFFLAVRDDLVEELLVEYGDPYQVVVSQLKDQ